MTAPSRPTVLQLAWLVRGLPQPGGKLPLFDEEGQTVDRRTVESCLANGWAEPWFSNPLKPDWRVCRLTDAGRRLAASPPQEARREPAAAAPALPIRG
jgi:hypothetical protein